MASDPTRQKKTKTNVPVKASNGMIDLLLHPDNTVTVTMAYDTIEKILMQMQRDAVAKGGSDEDLLRAIKGIEMVDDTLKLFRAEGNTDLQAGN